jgi:hypothetical protein
LYNKVKQYYKLECYLREVLIINLLDDAHMRKYSILINSISNTKVQFLQSLAQSDLIYYLYYLFINYYASPLKERSSLIF